MAPNDHNETLDTLSKEVPTERKTIAVIEDENLFAKAVVRRLERAGYRCRLATALASARDLLNEIEPDLVLLDMRLPDGSGLDFLQELREERGAALPVIVMTAYGEVDDAVTAMKFAASDYLEKPLDLDELLLNVEKVIANGLVSRQLEYSRKRERNQPETVDLLGDSPEIEEVRLQIAKIAKLGELAEGALPTVLITGETGSGKDVTARLIHQQSARRERPFVHVDCAALPKDLIEAELFGHVKGAFTDAHSERTGLIEAAESGVVFLDEIGELPLEVQAKLLAVLERRSLRRIGSSREQRVEAWFIAATNRVVDEMVAAGSLRSDLYFRLKVLTIDLPPLAERGDDAVGLAEYYAAALGQRYGFGDVSISPRARACIAAYRWPGNVRELRHVIERAILLSSGDTIEESALAVRQTAPAETSVDLPALEQMTLEAMEQLMISRALERSDRNVSEAARQLGITRMAMRYRMQKYGLSL